jgi:hypothetical protein
MQALLTRPTAATAATALPHQPAALPRCRRAARLSARLAAPPSAANKQTTTSTTKTTASKPKVVQYGADWYAATRDASKPATVREELARRKAANEVTYRDRRLVSDAWDGSEFRGSKFNILTLLVILFVAVPVVGLGFAYKTYGVLWG